MRGSIIAKGGSIAATLSLLALVILYRTSGPLCAYRPFPNYNPSANWPTSVPAIYNTYVVPASPLGHHDVLNIYYTIYTRNRIW